MLWAEASRRALRTFFQTLSGTLPAVSLAFSKSIFKEVGVAVGSAAWAGLIAFVMNVSPVEASHAHDRTGA